MYFPLFTDKQAKTKCHQEADKETSLECQYKADSNCPFDVEILVYPAGTSTSCHYKFSAHKEILSKISDVFGAMLGGSFAESKSGRIVLKGVHPRAFSVTLHHLYGCNWNCAQIAHDLNSFPNTVCSEEDENISETKCLSNDISDTVGHITNDHHSLNSDYLMEHIFATKTSESEEDERCFMEARQCLEVLACANRFLLADLCTVCEVQLCNCLPLDNTNIHLPSLFAYCQIHEAKILPQQILDYILLQLGNPSLCSKLFREILAGPSGYAALMLIRDSICSFIKR